MPKYLQVFLIFFVLTLFVYKAVGSECTAVSDCSSGRCVIRPVCGSGNSDISPITLEEIKRLKGIESQIDEQKRSLADERRRFEQDKRQREQARSSSRISIQASITEPDANGVVTIFVQSNVGTASLRINGEEQGGDVTGKYTIKKIAMVGQKTSYTIIATDSNGNLDTKTLAVTRKVSESTAVFAQLNSTNIKEHAKRDAVAIIIGIQNYKHLAQAEYANTDAQAFYDYATRALGVPPENIKLLLDTDADQVDIYRALRNWLPVKVNKDKTDVYVFYSGHGLPSADGRSLYLLPHGADRDLIDKTAISQQEIVASIKAARPKAVTMFIDSCYSGQTRTGETLLASARPLALKSQASAFPPEFTVISAATPDQLSWSSADLKHGIFSFYLMKGMEGDADINQDGKITMSEMQEYLTDNVAKQAMRNGRTQHPQLIGDGVRVLVAK